MSCSGGKSNTRADLVLDSDKRLEVGKLLGHKTVRVTQDHYLNKHLSIELQDLFRGKPTKADRLQPLRSLATERFPGAPISIKGTALHQELREHPEYLALRQVFIDHKLNGASKAEIKSAKTKMDIKLAFLRRKATEQVRSDWIKAESSRYLTRKQNNSAGPNSDYVLPSFRATIVDLLYHSVEQSQEHRFKLFCSLRALFNIAYPCPHKDCKHHNEPFETKSALKNHQLQHKLEPTVYKCLFTSCISTFRSKSGLMRHCRDHRDNLGHPCPHEECEHHKTPFPTKKALAAHCKQSHRTQHQHFCSHEECEHHESPFLTKKALAAHYKQSHGTLRDMSPEHPAEVVGELVYNIKTGREEAVYF